jgi:RNA polymerase sigma-70 factor, ECF subfamily
MFEPQPTRPQPRLQWQRAAFRSSALPRQTAMADAAGRRPRLYSPDASATASAMENDRVRELLERVGRQDQSAFRELYKAFSRRVFAYALNMVKDHARAEEILVDTMHEVWRAPARFRGDSQFTTWLIGIARNKALMAYRSRRPDELHDDLDDIAETTAADTPDGFAQLAAKQRSEGVQVCMGKLSNEHRECMHLVFFEGLSLAEVAEVQGCPENTVKTRLFHARQKIKTCLRLMVEREGGSLTGARS